VNIVRIGTMFESRSGRINQNRQLACCCVQ